MYITQNKNEQQQQKNCSCSLIVQFQKISTLPPQKGLEFPGGGGCVRPKHLGKFMKLYWNFQMGGGSLKKKPSVEEEWKSSGTIQCNYLNMYISSKK